MSWAATRVRQWSAVTALVLVWLLVTGQSGFDWAVARQTEVTGDVDSRTNYLIVLGHDGSPDPDDNLAQLAGFMAVKRVPNATHEWRLVAWYSGIRRQIARPE